MTPEEYNYLKEESLRLQAEAFILRIEGNVLWQFGERDMLVSEYMELLRKVKQ